jgi:hypothetical protein
MPLTESIASSPFPRARLGAGAAFLGAAFAEGFVALAAFAGLAALADFAVVFAADFALTVPPELFFDARTAFLAVFLILAIL